MHIAISLADFSDVKALVTEASARARGHGYLSLAADAADVADTARRGVLFVTQGRDAKTIKQLATHLNDPGCPHGADRHPEHRRVAGLHPGREPGVAHRAHHVRLIHVIWRTNAALDKLRCIEQRTIKSLKGMSWSLLEDRTSLKPEAAADLDAWVARMTTMRAARPWLYKQWLREILGRQQIDVVRDMFWHWCSCVLRLKVEVEPTKEVAAAFCRPSTVCSRPPSAALAA